MEVAVTHSIHRPVATVYEAVVDPGKISGYFTTQVKGDFAAGQSVEWVFADVGVTLPVKVLEVEPNVRIAFSWEASGQQATVVIQFKKLDDHQVEIAITEGPFDNSETGIQRLLQQTQGWTDFICSLKAYLYTGINLRTGMKNP